ncbi:hypothetical protein FA048_10475 [Pedobacter polaris]|uniref:PsbP C-terminal domain-containing protein n=1 Tax=Pedobacter polaris TaxID=2571273 RepID=A0A4U1CST3_9SPHI|nr:hypothetical protein [Pedobacter polaris]TKC10596.1 hypothetical protein FA048_10475 [Pedobacter polaris]
MAIKNTLIVLFSLISLFAKAQTGWVKQKFGEKLTISFPAEVKKVSESTYIAKDSTGTVYGVVIMEIDQSAYQSTLSSDTLLVRLKFIDEVVASIKAKMPKYEIGDVKISETNTIKTYALEGTNPENKSTVYLKIFLVGDVSYSLTCFVPPGLDTKNKDLFLKNFAISK